MRMARELHTICAKAEAAGVRGCSAPLFGDDTLCGAADNAYLLSQSATDGCGTGSVCLRGAAILAVGLRGASSRSRRTNLLHVPEVFPVGLVLPVALAIVVAHLPDATVCSPKGLQSTQTGNGQLARSGVLQEQQSFR